VTLTRGYWLAETPCTQALWEAVMGENPSHFSRSGDGSDQVSGQDTSRFPVEQVLWEDATEFCHKLSAKEDKKYRLPKEAEWEYACRAGTTTPFHFGSVLNGRQANCDGSYPYGTDEKGPSLPRTTAVGSYRPNAFGLYDMHGNVWEWCADWCDDEYYANSPRDDPTGPATGSCRVSRGGRWGHNAGACRSAYRGGYLLGDRYPDLGFRVALVPAD